MTVFQWAYKVLSKNRKIFTVFVIILFLIIGYFAQKIRLEEDITKMMPAGENSDDLQFVLQNSPFSEKIIINVFLKDSDAQPSPDSLIKFADRLVSEITGQLMPVYINEINYKISDDLFFDVFQKIYNNLPLFLEEEDYITIDSLLEPDKLDKTLSNNYKALVSPASMVLKKFIKADPAGISYIVLNKLKNLQVDENFGIYKNCIFTEDKKNLLIFLTPSAPSSETSINGRLIKRLDALTDSLSSFVYPQVKAEYYGAAAISVGNAHRIKNDVITTVSIAFIIIITFITLFFRRKSIFLIIFLPAVFGAGFALALLFIFKSAISAIALGVGSVLVGITIDYALHFFTHYRSKGSVNAVIKDVSYPILLSCLTTASAFLCLLFVSSSALNDLGLIAALSITGAAIFTLLVLPQLMGKPQQKSSGLKSFSIIDKISSFNPDKNIYIIISVLLLSIVFAFTAPKVKFESDMNKMNYMPDKLKQAEDNLDRINNVKLKSLFIVSLGDNLNQALQQNEKTEQIIKRLKEEGLVKKSGAISEILCSDSLQKVRIDRWNLYFTGQKKDEIKKNLTEAGSRHKFNEKAFAAFFSLLDKNYQTVNPENFNIIKKLFLSNLISEKENRSLIVNNLKVEQEDKKAVSEAFSGRKNIVVLDKQYLTHHFIDILKNDFNKLVKISLVVVFCILLIAFGRIELALITFIPMAVSWLWTLGIMSILGIHFNIVNIIISTFIFGLGIDYSIFIMQGLLQEYKYGYKNLRSYKTSILLSAFTTIVGVGVLIFARHPALRSMALVSIIGILSVIFISFTLQPVFFRWLIYHQGKIRVVPVTFKNLIFSLIAFIVFFTGSIFLTIAGVIILFLIPATKEKRKLIFHVVLKNTAWLMIYIMGNVKKDVLGFSKERFSNPAIIICNHQSHIDVLLILMLYPKIIILTNEWVQKNIFYSFIVKMADFYPVIDRIENHIEKIGERVSNGYSVLVFPEGSRSVLPKIRRFHKGAFYLAEKLKLDILPVILHGVGDCITKGEPFLKSGSITIKILDRIKYNDKAFGANHTERSKMIRKLCQSEFEKMRLLLETPGYYHNQLIKNYIYKGPVLEWYLRIKLRLEENYSLFDHLLPKKGVITDIGCGYGFMAYMLKFVSNKREITGVDYDREKTDVAAHCIRNRNPLFQEMSFVYAGAENYRLEQSDGIILSDILHYLPYADQEKILKLCISKLKPGGMLIIREGNTELQKRHKGTRISEIFSTRLLNFNKTKNDEGKLFFTSKQKILSYVENAGLSVEVIDKTKHNSNLIYVIKKTY